MPEQDVTTTINVETGAAESGVSSLDERLGKLEQAFVKISASSAEAGAGTEKAGSAAGGAAQKHQTLAEKIEAAVARQKEHAAVSQGVARALESETGAVSRLTAAMETHGRTIAMADDALGMKFGGSVSRVTAGMGALQGAFGSTLGPIALITAGVVAAGAAFTFLKDSVDKASEWEANMQRLGQTVKDQGGNWAALRGEVQQWADLQESTTTYSRDETVQALTELTATGMGLSDAMKTVRVAEDAAAATGKSLGDVTHGLMEAEHGRTRVLAELGIGTRQTMHDGMAYNDVLKAIETQMGGSAQSATLTYAGAQAQLRNEWQSLEENIGSKLLPLFTHIVEDVEAVVYALEHWRDEGHAIVKAVEDYFIDWYRSTLGIFTNLGKAADDFFHGHFAAAAADARAALADIGDVEIKLATGLSGVLVAAGHGALTEANYLFNKARSHANAADTNTGVTAEIGGKLPNEAAAAAKAAAAAAKALRDEIALTIKSLENERNAHKLTIDAEIADLKKLLDNHKLTGMQRAEITGKIIELQKREAAETAAATKKIQEELKKRQEAQRAEYDELQRHLDATTKIAEDTYGKNSEAYKTALQNEMKALDDWLAHNKDANQQLVDDAKVKYAETFKAYNDEIDAEDKAADEHEKKMEEQYTKLLDAQQKWADKAAGFLESFFQKGKKGTVDFAQAWHDMLKKMEEYLLKSALSKMLLGMFGVGGSAAGLGALFGEPQGQAAAASSNASQGGILGAMLGPSGAASVASSLPTGGGLMSMIFGSSAPSPTGGAGGGGTTNVVTTIVAAGSGVTSSSGTVQDIYSAAASGGSGAGSGLPGIGGIPWGDTFHGATLGSWAAAGAGGALVGSLLYGGRGFADLGGAVGGMAGLGIGLAADLGPWGLLGSALIGAIAGGGIGSMFNHDNPSEMPDKYATGSFGQGMADFSGAGVNGVPQFNANGQGFSENASLYAQLNHMGMGAYIGSYIASTGGAGLTSNEIAEFRGTRGALVSLHNGYLTIDNGQTIWWETLVSDAHDAVNRIMQAGGAPVFDVSHSLPDFGGAMITSAGNYAPASPSGGSSGISPSVTPPTGGGAGSSINTTTGSSFGRSLPGGVNVTVNVGGTIITSSDLMQYISEGIAALLKTGPQAGMSMFARTF